MTASEAIADLKKYKSKDRARTCAWFFKTGVGQYGEGDVFIGVTVPDTRIVAQKYKKLPLPEVRILLGDSIHEVRLLGLLILVYAFKKSDEKNRTKIYSFLLKNISFINNWDLVDSTASQIIGEYLVDKDRSVIYKLARSKNLWERRISIVATYAFIRQDQYDDTFSIAKILMPDSHDLIHKAIGWMLREVGKRDEPLLVDFLGETLIDIPRTSLRYAIERLQMDVRQEFLNAKRIYAKRKNI